jgi:hypothetical protein
MNFLILGKKFWIYNRNDNNFFNSLLNNNKKIDNKVLVIEFFVNLIAIQIDEKIFFLHFE